MVNPFPNLGTTRIWTEEYIQHRINSLEKIDWICIGKLIPENLNTLSNCSSIYCFVRSSAIENLSPTENNAYPLIVYIGQTKKIRSRLKEYLKDKRAIQRYSTSSRNIRDGIKNMFSEYGDNLTVYYAICKPDELRKVEDILIQLFDPVFNFEQRLNEGDFNEYSRVITAKLYSGEEAYTNFSSAIEKSNDANSLKMSFGVGKPVSAF